MYIFWAVVSFIFLFWDFKKTNIIKLTCACSFMFGAIIAYKFPSDYKIQILSFLVFSMIFYFLIKSIFKKEKSDLKKLTSFADFSDKTAIVVKDIGKTLSIDGIGAVKLNNPETWSAKSIDDKEIKAGAKVEIVSRENMILNVKVVK